MPRHKQPSNANTNSSILIKFNWGEQISGSCYNDLNPKALYNAQGGPCLCFSIVRLVIIVLFLIAIFTSCTTHQIEFSDDDKQQKQDTTASAYDPDTPNDSTTFNW